jgi:predicted amidohydrolase YtcJ
MNRMFVLGGVFACASALAASSAQPADTVLVHGRIVTLDAKSTVVEVLAIRDGRIVAVGAFAKVKSLIAKETRVAQGRGKELEDDKTLTQLLPMGFGDSMLRFSGIGENVAWGVYNNDDPGEASREQLYRICQWATSRGLALNIHWHNDKSAGVVLDVFERVNREYPIAKLCWTLAHLEDASEPTLKRMKTLGVGWALQDAGYFEGESQLKEKGAEAMKRLPRINSALYIGVHVGAGTDAHRVASYNPWVALRWMLDGKTVGGAALRGPEETPIRENAQRMYTQGSAWFAFAEKERGSLEVGKLADLAVLSKDYFKVPAEEIGEIEAVMTVVGGRGVYEGVKR